MAEPATEIFSGLLPSIPASVALKYAESMCSYYSAFVEFRGAAMSYECLPGYMNAQHAIVEVPKDHFWPFSPHFRKCVCLTLQGLFKTKITSFGMSPISMDQNLVFVDGEGHRWIMSLMESPADPAMNVIYMHFPRSKTPICQSGDTAKLEALNDPAFKSYRALLVCDTAYWNDPSLRV